MVQAIKELGPILLDFGVAAAGAGKVIDKAADAVKGLKDEVNKPIDDALAKVANAGKRIIDKALNRIIPNSAGSPDYKGLVGPVMTLTVDNETHRVWARYNKATGKIEVMLASLPDDFATTVAAWKTAWAFDPSVTKLISALQTELGKTTKEAKDLAAPNQTLTTLSAKKPSELSKDQKEQLKQALATEARELAEFQKTLETKDHKPTGTELALQKVLLVTHGEWAPGHSISGIKTADKVDELLKQRGKSLSKTDRAAIISLVEKQGAFGGWGDETTLAREIVGRVLAESSGSVGAAISSETSAYFGHAWITTGRKAFDDQIKKFPTGYTSWHDYISRKYGKDALNRTRDQYYDLLNTYINPTSSKYDSTYAANYPAAKSHGHHIVWKKGPNANSRPGIEPAVTQAQGEEAAQEARDILIFYGIDPYFGQENLVYAPNFTHYADIIVSIDEKLNRAYRSHEDKPQIVSILTTAANEWIAFP